MERGYNTKTALSGKKLQLRKLKRFWRMADVFSANTIKSNLGGEHKQNEHSKFVREKMDVECIATYACAWHVCVCVCEHAPETLWL